MRAGLAGAASSSAVVVASGSAAAGLEASAAPLDWATEGPRYRDRIQSLSFVTAQQGINPETVEEADVFAAQTRAEWPRERWDRYRPLELRGSGIHVFSVQPGPVETGMIADSGSRPLRLPSW